MSEAVRESYQDDLGYEILGGKIFNRSPVELKHAMLVGNIYVALHDYSQGKSCQAFLGGLTVDFSEKDKVLPDSTVVCRPEIIGEDGIYGAPDLVVEVLSLRTVFNDRGYKKSLYERNGVREYWIVDIKNRAVEVYRLTDDGYELDQVYVQHTPDDLELLTDEERQQAPKAVRSCIFSDLEIGLEDVFADVWA